ncbi:unnamed protein product [Diplocarpon coronariae]|uniref:Uncharacterized protein n=1 Tax=Diplocarpon coronariae TaxID=2795749 RepID=A0A218YVL3_9HELO|nr:hypothetical protein JHW43_003221 [Diplocarpon mali]OWO99858.1 hypothetical protein B2J93_6913 [Marssonina coronariae]
MRADDGSESAVITLPYRGAVSLQAQANETVQNFAYHPDVTSGTSKAFRTSVVKTYRTDQLGSRAWECRFCGKLASQVHYAATSILSPSGSSLVDGAIPTCTSTKCYHQGSELAHQCGKNAAHEPGLMSCGNCGGRSRTALCGQCTFSYGSRNSIRPAIRPKKPRSRGKKIQPSSDSGRLRLEAGSAG